MLNIIWPLFILISFIYAFLTKNINNVNQSIFEGVKNAVELTLTFFGTICLWTGIMKIAQKTSIISKLANMLKPIINFLFPDIKDNNKAKEEISMNIIANILGLGNAATPMGLKAMKTLQKGNPKKDSITPAIAMFIVINTASIQLIPTTVIAIRASLNSENLSQIIFPVWGATIAAFFAAVISVKIFISIDKRRNQNIWK